MKFKRLLSGALAAAVALSTMALTPFTTASAADVVATGSCGDNATYTLDSDGVLTISGTGTVTAIDGDFAAFANENKVAKVIVEEGITELGEKAFYEGHYIESISLPDTLTTIGESALSRLTNPFFSKIEIPSSVTTIKESAFQSSNALRNVSIPDGVTEIPNFAFNACSYLKTVTIGKGVTTIDPYAFFYLPNISDFYIYSKDVSTVYTENVSSNYGTFTYNFYGRPPVFHVYEGSTTEETLKAKGYTNIEYITEETVEPTPVGTTGKCGKDVTWTFDKDTGVLTLSGTGRMYEYGAIEIPEWEYMVYKDEIKKVVIGEYVTSIGRQAFKGTAVEEIEFESTTIPCWFSFLPQSFEDCTKLKKLDLIKERFSAKTTGYDFEYDFKSPYSNSVSSDKQYTYTSTFFPFISRGAFKGCTSLELVTIPYKSTSYTGGLHMDPQAFMNCTSLKTFISASDITFDWCSAASYETIASGQLSQSYFGGQFYNCPSLETFAILYPTSDLDSSTNIKWNTTSADPDIDREYPQPSWRHIIYPAFDETTNATFYMRKDYMLDNVKDNIPGISDDQLVKVAIYNEFDYYSWKVEDLFTTAEQIAENEEDYTLGSYAKFKQAYDEAIRIKWLYKSYPSATSGVFDTITTDIYPSIEEGNRIIGALYAAVDQLELFQGTIDTSLLESAISDGEAIDASLYTESTVAKLTEVINAGKAVLANTKATLDEINNAAAAINEAIEGLVNISILQTAISDGEAIDTSLYAEATVAKLTEAINAGKVVLANTEATQDEVDNAAAAINKAINALTNFSILQTAISNGEAVDTSLYTEETVAALTEAITAGKAVLANTEATQDEVNNAAAAIDKAIEGLAKAKEIYDISENQDGSVTAILYYSDGSLVISGTGATKNYNLLTTTDKAPWQYDDNSAKITSVEVKDGVTSLGNDLFAQLPNMESVSIPDTVTSIGSRCFGTSVNYPNKLTSVVIPESVTSIGANAFAYSASLVSVTLPSGLTSIPNNLFTDCTSLTTVNIPDPVTSIGNNAFYNCSSLTSVTLPDSVTSIGDNAFQRCSSLTSVNIPSSLTTLGGSVFKNCNLTGKVVIPEGVTVLKDNIFMANPSAELEIYVMGAITKVGTLPFSGGAGKIYVYDANTYNLITGTDCGAFEIIYDGEVDTSDLEAVIAQAETLNESDYTADTWAVVVSALEAAKAELANEDKTATSVIAAATALTNAIDGLIEEGKYMSYIYKNGKLTDIVSCSVTDDMAGATKVKVNFDCASDTSYNPNAAIDFLINNNWDNNYEFKGTYGYDGGTKDCSETLELSSALVKGNSFTLTGYTYAWSSAADYVYAVSSVDFLDADGNVLYTITSHTFILDTTALESAIAKGEAVNADKYTAESYAVLTSAISAGKTVLANAEATQEDIDAAAKAITDAIAALKLNIVTGTVSGTIYVSDEEAKTEMTVVAVAADGTEVSETAMSMGTYTLEDLAAGDYTLTISGGKYAPRSYEITVEAGDNAQDVKLNPYGDINGDGDITTADVGMANSHAKGVRTLTDYDFVCADVKIDGSISTADVGMINSHAKGVKTLW